MLAAGAQSGTRCSQFSGSLEGEQNPPRSRRDAAGVFDRKPRWLPRRIRPCDCKPRPTFGAGFHLLNRNAPQP